jgi:hypothetical protein
MNLTRRNYLRYLISTTKAEQSGQWQVTRSEVLQADPTVWINPNELMNRLSDCESEGQVIEKCFADYPKYLSYEYASIFSQRSEGVSEEFLKTFARWLGVKPSFTNQSHYRKQSNLPIRSTISNYAEIEPILKGTRFQYCLEDEALYRAGDNRSSI